MRASHNCGTDPTTFSRREGKLQQIKNLLKRCQPKAKTQADFPATKLFELNSRFLQGNLEERDRIFLIRRLTSYAYGGRRGRVSLPARFPRELRAFASSLTRSQTRQMMHWVRPSASVDRGLSKSSIDMVKSVLPNHLWTGNEENFEAMARRVDTHRLSKRDAPRGARALWPSFPSFTEMLEMARRGIPTTGLTKPRITVKDCITEGQVRRSSYLATGLVTKNIIGIRASRSVPRKFLPWFRYRDGFLILVVRYHIPIGLVRFLLSSWIKCPTSLWLVEPCRFRYYLKTQRLPYKRMEIVLCTPPASKTEESAERALGTGHLAAAALEAAEARKFLASLLANE